MQALLLALILALSSFALAAAPSAAAGGGRWYFAEGYTGPGFQEYLCIANPDSAGAPISVTCFFNGGGARQERYVVPARSRFTIDVNRVVGANREVSILVDSSTKHLVLERPVYFSYQGGPTGGHTVSAAGAPSRTWYFAEGYTGPGFDEYLCVLNPGDAPAGLTFRFQTADRGEVVRDGLGVAGGSRATFKVNDLLGQGVESSVVVESDRGIVVERPTYFTYSPACGRSLQGGHCVMGATSLNREYFFAEGTTRQGFEQWLTIQNPAAAAVRVEAEYQFGPGQGSPKRTSYAVPARSRRTVDVPAEVGPGRDVSVHLSSNADFLAERPVYYGFTHNGLTFEGGHCAMGARSETTASFLAEGYTGPSFEAWVCLQNRSDSESVVEFRYLTEEAGELPARTVRVPANTRTTVFVNEHAGPGYQVATSLRVVSGPSVVVERPLYFDREKWSPPAPAEARPLYGLCFSPYLHENPLDGGSVSVPAVAELFDIIAPYTRWVRTFGSQGEWSAMPGLARERGLKIAGGCDIYTDRERNDREVAALVGQARAGSLDMAVVGDEVMYQRLMPESELAGYIRRVRATGVPTGTSDTYAAWLEHPALMDECDVILVNIYPYWEGLDVGESVARLASAYERIKAMAGGRRVIIETGWPSGGQVVGRAVPSVENAARYLCEFVSWARSAGAEYFYFEAFDELWKTCREGACGSNWGVWGHEDEVGAKPGFAESFNNRY